MAKKSELEHERPDRTPQEKFEAFKKLLKAIAHVPKREVKSAR